MRSTPLLRTTQRATIKIEKCMKIQLRDDETSVMIRAAEMMKQIERELKKSEFEETAKELSEAIRTIEKLRNDFVIDR